jgi:hypothetical protein
MPQRPSEAPQEGGKAKLLKRSSSCVSEEGEAERRARAALEGVGE